MKIGIVGAGELAKVIAERAKDLGIESIGFSYKNQDIACKSFNKFYEVDIFNVANITEICKEAGVNGIVSTTEITVLPAAIVAKNLGLIGNSINITEDITNKYLIRNKVITVNNLKQPKFIICKDGNVPEVNSYPVIVKPIAAGGKRGVCVVHTPDALSAAISAALSFSRIKGVLIEEYLKDGIEYSIESLSFKGNHYVIQVTQKDTSGSPHCNELGHHQPADLTIELRGKVEKVVSDMLSAVGITNGPCHTEIKIINNDIYLIEINGRAGGDHIAHPLTELSTGYPYVSGLIWIALGEFEGHEPFNLEHNYSGIYFITEETAYLKPLFDDCESFPWFYKKNKISESPSKITYNDADNLNYFIYYCKEEKPDISNYL